MVGKLLINEILFLNKIYINYELILLILNNIILSCIFSTIKKWS